MGSLIPAPPLDLAGDPHVDGIVMTVMAVLFLAGALYAAFSWLRSGSPLVAVMFLGGGCMMVMEPMVDSTAGVWFAASSRMFLHGWGRSIPVWVCLTYFVYFGVGSAILCRFMQRGASARALWLIYGAEVLADVILESLVLHTGIYSYYGAQPLLLGPFPLWWAAVNALVSLVSAYVVVLIAPACAGWGRLAIVPAMLCASAAANAAAGWPAWFVINSDLGPVATQLGGLASVAIALALVALICALVARAGPATQRATPLRAGR